SIVNNIEVCPGVPPSFQTQPLAITVDVEDWYHIPSVTGSPLSVYKDINKMEEKTKMEEKNFERAKR
ncbi:MAG: hypothetical protein KAT65_16080, partial [Methanophagales archaeon]|nr:hypothetical protein [Methanophagales archaeon]